jgi:hypothetical protein
VRDLCRTALAATVQPRPDSVAADRLADSCKSPPIREGPSPHLYGGNSGLTPGPSTIDNLQNAHRATDANREFASDREGDAVAWFLGALPIFVIIYVICVKIGAI